MRIFRFFMGVIDFVLNSIRSISGWWVKRNILNNQYKSLRAHINSADQLLLHECENLADAIKKETDPVKRCRLALGMVELKEVLKKRKMLMDDYGL